MTFKEIKQGYSVYLLNRANDISVSVGKVKSISMPRIPSFQNMNFTQTQQMVVDVTIENGNNTETYTIPDNLDLTYAGNDLVISTSREAILREVESMKNKAEDIINSVGKNKKIITACDKILIEFNPAFKEKKENEERIGKMETQIGEMSEMIKNLLNKLS